MYETMVFWETVDTGPDQAEAIRDYAEIWRTAEKIVFSRTLARTSSAGTWIERKFDPETIRQLKQTAGSDISIGGPELTGHAIAAGLVDECHLLLVPVVVGGGKRALPSDGRLRLELLDERRFEGGAVHLHYRLLR
jgi:dihydrofolate reductase